MSLVNQDKPNTSISNSTRISIGETWASIPTTWATETRTWEDMQSLIDNVSRTSSSLTNINKPA